MIQKFCNILVIWGTIKQLWRLLPKSWRWWTILGSKMPSSPDTLQVPQPDLPLWLGAWPLNPVLDPPDHAWSSRFIQVKFPEQSAYCTVINCTFLNNVFGCFSSVMAQLKIFKAEVPKLDYSACSFVWLSNHTWSKAMLNMSAHQLPQLVLLHSYDICTTNKYANKISQNFWLTLLVWLV